MAKTKIIVLKLKKLLRFGIPAAVVLVLFVLMLLFFSGKEKGKGGNPPDAVSQTQKPRYQAGNYNSTITLGDATMNLAVVVDSDRVKSIRLTYLDETAAVMYPLFAPAAEDLGSQLASGTPLSELVLSDSSHYTQTLLLGELEKVLQRATVPNELSDILNE